MTTEMFAPALRDIVSQRATLERVSGGYMFTEGPVWNQEDGYLVWTEIIGDTIYKWAPGEGTSVLMRPSGKADGMTHDLEGRLVVAGWSSRTVWRLEHDGSTTTLATHYNGIK
jgi:gluconolactonase